MKIAIVGSGAAAVGVLRAVEEWCPGAEVTLIDRAQDPAGPFMTDEPPRQRKASYSRQLYRYLRRAYGLKFPPPKTNFGYEPSKYQVPNWGGVWRSTTRGGLTNFWGASSLPFTDADLRDWPIEAADLAPYYRRMSEQIGVSGCHDAITEHLGTDFVNRPPISRPPIFSRLEAAINGDPLDTPFRLVAGTSRLAVETRENQVNRCLYEGDCMTGCSARAVWSAAVDVERHDRAGRISRTIVGRALAVQPEPLALSVEGLNGVENVGPFDRIFLCAGCIGTTEIVMRSLGWQSGPIMSDNAAHTFPILYLGAALCRADGDRHFGLTNLLAYCVPERIDGRTAMIQAYPNVDYLWRYYVSPHIWRAFEPLGRASRRRLIWGRIFLHGDHSQQYAFALSNNDRDLALSLARPSQSLRSVPGLWQSIRASTNRKGFFVPDVPPVRHATSSHYSASLPMGTPPVKLTGEFLPGAYVCDSAAFPNAPAPSLTLTIMANACRIAHRSLVDSGDHHT